ncbi:hypothetical protein ABRQ07_22380 [Pectobacterium polonicum]|uniref:Uncharacterized protein n=1 Tax=Pectobacterium polonicum TaxID=2485124 RepID=A0ABV1PGM6_9GAMM
MKIDYRDSGSIARLTLRSSILAIHKHQRAVDAAMMTAQVTEQSSGWLFRRTVITGRTAAVMQAYKVVMREVSR